MESNDKHKEADKEFMSYKKSFLEQYKDCEVVSETFSEVDKEENKWGMEDVPRMKQRPKDLKKIHSIVDDIVRYAMGCDWQHYAINLTEEGEEKLKNHIYQQIDTLSFSEKLLLESLLSDETKSKDAHGYNLYYQPVNDTIHEFITLISERMLMPAIGDETSLKSAYPSHRGTVGKKVPNDNLGSSKKSINKHNI